MPSSRAANARTSCGVCVEAQIVSSPGPGSHCATMPRVSIGTAAQDCCVITSAITCGASAKTASRPGAGGPWTVPGTLSGNAACTTAPAG